MESLTRQPAEPGLFNVWNPLIALIALACYLLCLGLYRCRSLCICPHRNPLTTILSIFQSSRQVSRSKVCRWVTILLHSGLFCFCQIDLRLVALTTWYQGYYDIWLRGQYIWRIKEMHEQYGECFGLTSLLRLLIQTIKAQSFG